MVDKNINTDVELTIELYREDDPPDTNNKHDVMIIEQKKAAELSEKVSEHEKHSITHSTESFNAILSIKLCDIPCFLFLFF